MISNVKHQFLSSRLNSENLSEQLPDEKEPINAAIHPKLRVNYPHKIPTVSTVTLRSLGSGPEAGPRP